MTFTGCQIDLLGKGMSFLMQPEMIRDGNRAKEIMTKAGGFVLDVAKPLLIELMKTQVNALLTQ